MSKDIRVKIVVLNQHGDENLDMLLSEAQEYMSGMMNKGMWVFDGNNNLVGKDNLSSAFKEGGEATIMPASVGG